MATDFFANICTIPLKAKSIEREAIQDEIRILQTRNEIIAPVRTPTMIPAKIPRKGFTSPTSPITTPLKANTAPTERSISPLKITNVIPKAKSPPFLDAFKRMFIAFSKERKCLSRKIKPLKIQRSRKARKVLFNAIFLKTALSVRTADKALLSFSIPSSFPFECKRQKQ